MRKSTSAGITLIELLIVVAIISIVTAGSLAVLTAPAEENVFANADCDAEAGFAMATAALVNDAHSATTATMAAGVLVFTTAGTAQGTSVYFADTRLQLRRASADAGSLAHLDAKLNDRLGQAMITHPCTWNAEVSTDSVSLTIGIEQKQLFRDTHDTRTLTLLLAGGGNRP